MAENREAQREVPDPRIGELDRESVELKQPTRISGRDVRAGESVEVYPFQKRHLVWGNYAEGGLEDIASPAEIAQGNLEALKPAEEQEGYVSEEELWEKGATSNTNEDEVVVAGSAQEQAERDSGKSSENSGSSREGW